MISYPLNMRVLPWGVLVDWLPIPWYRQDSVRLTFYVSIQICLLALFLSSPTSTVVNADYPTNENENWLTIKLEDRNGTGYICFKNLLLESNGDIIEAKMKMSKRFVLPDEENDFYCYNLELNSYKREYLIFESNEIENRFKILALFGKTCKFNLPKDNLIKMNIIDGEMHNSYNEKIECQENELDTSQYVQEFINAQKYGVHWADYGRFFLHGKLTLLRCDMGKKDPNEDFPICGIKASARRKQMINLDKEYRDGNVLKKPDKAVTWLKNSGGDELIATNGIYEECYDIAWPTMKKKLYIEGCFNCKNKDYKAKAEVKEVMLYQFSNCWGYTDAWNARWFDAPMLAERNKIKIEKGSMSFSMDYILDNGKFTRNKYLIMTQCYHCMYGWAGHYYKHDQMLPYDGPQKTLFLLIKHTCSAINQPRYQVIRLDAINWVSETPYEYIGKEIELCSDVDEKTCFSEPDYWVWKMFDEFTLHYPRTENQHGKWIWWGPQQNAYVTTDYRIQYFGSAYRGNNEWYTPNEIAKKYGTLLSKSTNLTKPAPKTEDPKQNKMLKSKAFDKNIGMAHKEGGKNLHTGKINEHENVRDGKKMDLEHDPLHQ